MDADARSVAGAALLAIQASLLLPLIWRARRGRSAVGISLAGEAIWIAAGGGWAVYGWLTDSPVLAASGTLAAVGSATLVALLWSAGPRVDARRAAWAGTAAALALAIAGALGGVVGLGIALAVLGVLQFVPQILTSARRLTQPVPAPGVSVVAAVLRALYCLGWALFAATAWVWPAAASQVDWPLAVWGVAGACAYVLQAVATRRGRVGA